MIMKEANAQIKDPCKEAIGITLWTLASRTIVYNETCDSVKKLTSFKLLETNTNDNIALYKCSNYQGLR